MEKPTEMEKEKSMETETKPSITEKETEKETSKAEEEETPNLEWRCFTCGKTALPTRGAYMGLIKHKCTGKREVWLVKKDTGEKLYQRWQEADQRGLLTGEEPPEVKPKAKTEKEGEITEPQVSSEGFFRYTITLPADAFTLFNMAKVAGLEKDEDKPFDVWVWDCIRKRFEKDYKRQVILAGMGEE